MSITQLAISTKAQYLDIPAVPANKKLTYTEVNEIVDKINELVDELNLKLQTATTTTEGVLEIGTVAEMRARTATDKTITPYLLGVAFGDFVRAGTGTIPVAETSTTINFSTSFEAGATVQVFVFDENGIGIDKAESITVNGFDIYSLSTGTFKYLAILTSY